MRVPQVKKWYTDLQQRGNTMKLLIKKIGMDHLAAHMVNEHGLLLCSTNIKVADWEVQDVSPNRVICHACKRIYDKANAPIREGEGKSLALGSSDSD
jgi:hypothetical protein